MSFQDLHTGSYPSRSSSSSHSQPVAAGIFQLNTAVATFRRLVDAIGTSKDTPDHRRKLHNTRQRILQLVKETYAKLKTLSQSDQHTTVNKVEDAKLARDFQTVMQDFQKVQQLASQRESTYSPSLPTSSIAIDDSGSSESAASESQPFLREQKRVEILLLDNEIVFNEAIIEEREQGFREIQGQMGEASEIFKDLAVLAHEQGGVIDDIHSNIESSSLPTTDARVQLAKGSKSVKSRQSCCWWLLALVILALLILALVLIL